MSQGQGPNQNQSQKEIDSAESRRLARERLRNVSIQASLRCGEAKGEIYKGHRYFSGMAEVPSKEATDSRHGRIVVYGHGMKDEFFVLGRRYVMTLVPESEVDCIERRSPNGLETLANDVFDRFYVAFSQKMNLVDLQALDKTGPLMREVLLAIRSAMQDAVADRK